MNILPFAKINEIYTYRNVLKSLVVKNLFGRYKNSVFGFCWHFVRPVILLIVYYIVFTEIRTSVIPDFWVFLFSSLFPFSFLLTNLVSGAGSIVNNAGMVKKMYFPREILVLSQIISSEIIMLIGYGISLLIVILSGYPVNINIIWVPITLILCTIFAIGYSLLFSAIAVYVRDVIHLLGSINLIVAFTTPVFFVSDQIGGVLGNIIWFNPFTYYIEMLHSAIYYGVTPDLTIIAISIVICIITLICGWGIFDKLKGGFADKL